MRQMVLREGPWPRGPDSVTVAEAGAPPCEQTELSIMKRPVFKAERTELATYHRTVEMFFKELRDKPEICTAEWTLESMAQHCKMGTTKFSRCSHDIANVSPWEYLTICRLDLAKQLLKDKPERNVTDLAFDCGFNSSQYFATRFRRRFKCSPRECRGEEHA